MPYNLNDPEVDSGGKYIDTPGWHTVTATKYTKGVSEKKGTPFVEYTFQNEHGQERTSRFYTGKSSLWRLKLFAIACGLGSRHLDSLDDDDLIGRKCDIRFEDDGSEKHYIQASNDFQIAGRGEVEGPLKRTKQAATGDGEPEKPRPRLDDAAQTSAAAAALDDDDIPF